jgi:hypothetical protein
MSDQRQNIQGARRRGVLPTGPNRQLIMGGAAIVVIGILMTVVSGMPAVGLIIAGCALAVFGLRVLVIVLTRPRYDPMPPPARQPYPAVPELDEPSRALLQRAASAISAITSSQICRDGVVDRGAVRAALARQQRHLDSALRERARLRAWRAATPAFSPGPATAMADDSQSEAAQLAESSLTAQVDALERYAAEIREADAAYTDWQQASPAGQPSQHLDLISRTAADEHRIAEIEAMSRQARAVRLLLSEPPASTTS